MFAGTAVAALPAAHYFIRNFRRDKCENTKKTNTETNLETGSKSTLVAGARSSHESSLTSLDIAHCTERTKSVPTDSKPQ